MKIFEKVQYAIVPEFEDEKSFDPFNFWEGAPFKLKIRNVENYINYDKSEFGECAPLFENDAELENIWKSQYHLQDFLETKNFKSYDEIKTKFNSTINAVRVVQPQENAEEDELPQKPVRPPKSTPDVVKTKSASSDEDDFELFRNMIDD